MKKNILVAVASLSILITPAFTGTKNWSPGHKVNINTEDSKIQFTGTRSGGEHNGSAKLTGGELVLDNTEIMGGSFTMDLNSVNNKESKARFEIKKVTKLPVTRTEQGDIKFTHTIVGELTMKGQTKTISFDASVNMLKGKVAASSEAFNIDNDISLKLDLVTD